MPRFWIAIALGLTVAACASTPVDESGLVDQKAVSTEPALSTKPGFEGLERGIGVTVQQATYGGYADTALEDALSYAAQGDETALSELLEGDYPEAIALPVNTALRFEGCYYGDDAAGCRLVWVRVEGGTEKWVVQPNDLAIGQQ